jgi:hypothetical protein
LSFDVILCSDGRVVLQRRERRSLWGLSQFKRDPVVTGWLGNLVIVTDFLQFMLFQSKRLLGLADAFRPQQFV